MMTYSIHETIIDKYIEVISCSTMKDIDFFIRAEKFLDTRSYVNAALIFEDMIKGRQFEADWYNRVRDFIEFLRSNG